MSDKTKMSDKAIGTKAHEDGNYLATMLDLTYEGLFEHLCVFMAEQGLEHEWRRWVEDKVKEAEDD